MKKKITNFGAYLSLAGLIASCSSTSLNRIVADDDGFSPRTAYEAWGELNYAATSYSARALLVGGESMDGFRSGVTYGAEKEASSALITRVMGPPSSEFIEKVDALSEENKKEFLKDFLSNYVKDSNGYRTYLNDDGVKVDLAVDVKDAEGNPKVIDLSEIKEINFEEASVDELSAAFKKFIDQTDDKPMTFIKPMTKSKIFNGELPGLDGNLFKSWGSNPNYMTWTPNFGNAQKYLVNAHGHGGGQGGGWEINFQPLDTYGEFEEMVLWFRTELKQVIKDPATLEKKIKLFQAPGHQRMVFKEHPELPKPKLAELYRMIQSYIVLKGISGRTGIEFANFKRIYPDSTLAEIDPAHWHNRGVLRIEGPRWGSGTHGIEFRAGTKDLDTARFYQTVLAARVSSNDFNGLAEIGNYSLYSGDNTVSSSAVAQRIGMDEAQVNKAKDVLRSVGIKDSYQVQFWNWTGDDIPFIKAGKKELVKGVTRDFVKLVADLESIEDISERKTLVRKLNKEWVLQTRVIQSIEEYIRPRQNFAPDMNSLEYKAAEGRPVRANPVDVNNIDLGIEYSGKFPLMVRGDFSDERLGDNKRAWIQTRGDLTEEERKQIIKNVATSLKSKLGGSGDVVEVDADGHGHGLDVAFNIRDAQDRKWIVEWDGIGRSYDDTGEIIEDSPRGGSIELVTPKFVPKIDEIQAVYQAFEENDILPQLQGGGGHINVDLAAFDGKPKELARFLAVFHEHRSVISLMFQHVNRVKTSEPVEVSDNLSQKLRSFDGSEEDLKNLLYEERYFNTRFGRKTRYVQIDMSAYFQDIIPDEFVTDDFDIASPTVPWRRQFRVDPNIRKMEFRMFNAPRDAMESGLQIKLVRAILNRALNETDEVSGTVSKTSHLEYLEEPDKAMEDLKKMCDDLGLDVDEFRPQVSEGLAETDKASRSVFFQNFEEKMVLHPPQRGWGDPVGPRSSENALNSADREWVPGPSDELNTMTNEHRVEAAQEGMRQRQSIVPAREVPGEFVRTENCADLLTDVL